MNNLLRFRHILQEIVDNNTGDKTKDQITLISNLSKEFNHSIILKKEANLSNESSWRYNCFTYAFNLLNSSEFLDITERYPFLFAEPRYASYLINNYLCKISETEAVNEDYIIYFHEKMPKHAGKYFNGKIISKWGHFHLLEHEIYEVPSSYGDEIQFFKKISVPECVSAFKQWVDKERNR